VGDPEQGPFRTQIRYEVPEKNLKKTLKNSANGEAFRIKGMDQLREITKAE